MDFATAGTDLEQQAAQLLLKLQVTSNPAFSDETDGGLLTDEELMIKADPFTAAARRNGSNNAAAANGNTNNNYNYNSNTNTFQHYNNNNSFTSGNGSFDEFASAATSAAVAANADFMAALSSSSTSRSRSRRRKNNNNNFNGDENGAVADDDDDANYTNSYNRPNNTAASFEIEAFRMVLRQQRAPSLRLLAAVSKTAVPALMCVLCNAQSFDSFDELCSGGRFDSLYYDAKFKAAREHEKQKEKERAQRIEERRHCLFKPRTKENIAAELIARKRGQVYVDPQEEALAKKEAERIDRLNKSLRMPNQQQQQEKKKSTGDDDDTKKEGEGDDKKDNKEKKEGENEQEEDHEEDNIESAAPRDPHAFFDYNMEWKMIRKRKLEKKLLKMKKEQEEQDAITYKQWEMSEESRKYAAARAEKKEKGAVRERQIVDPCTFTPSTTPYRSKKHSTRIEMDVVERLQVDITKRKEDQLLREIEELGKYRARTPRIEKTKMKEVVSELYHPTPKKMTTFRKPIPVETPTFSPKISRGPKPSVASKNSTSTTTTTAQNQKEFASPASDLSRERHSRRCITPYAVSKAQLRSMQVKPITDAQANARYRKDMDAMREREERLQEIRDTIEKKQAATCTFQNADLVLTEKNDRMTSRYYDGIEDEMMSLSKLEDQKKRLDKVRPKNTSSSRNTTPAASPTRRSANNQQILSKQFSPPHITPSRRLEIHNRACPTDGLSTERRRRVDGTENSTAFIRAGSFSPSPIRKRQQHQAEKEQTCTKENNNNNSNTTIKIETHIATNPADQQLMLNDLSDYFNKATSIRNSGPLLPLSHAIDLCHRIAVERKMIVSRILKWEDVQVIFPAIVSFIDFVKMFEIMAGSSLTEDFL